jgi:hypothetical protein
VRDSGCPRCGWRCAWKGQIPAGGAEPTHAGALSSLDFGSPRTTAIRVPPGSRPNNHDPKDILRSGKPSQATIRGTRRRSHNRGLLVNTRQTSCFSTSHRMCSANSIVSKSLFYAVFPRGSDVARADQPPTSAGPRPAVKRHTVRMHRG